MTDRQPEATTGMDEPPPPILRSWRNLYTAVLVALAVEVALFYAFTRMFS